MVRKFDPGTTPLNKAIPCIVELIRDSGAIEWYEDAKPGQLLQIETGKEKAYLNLDNAKTLNMTPEVEIIVEEDPTKDSPDEKITIRTRKGKKTEEKKLTIKELIGKYVRLSPNKIKEITAGKKPVMGFVCYEREFNPYPTKILHDSKQVTSLMDFIRKNYKDFTTQKIEAIRGTIVSIIVVLAIAVLAVTKFGGRFFVEVAEASAPKASNTPNVATVPIMFAMYNFNRLKQWLRNRRNTE